MDVKMVPMSRSPQIYLKACINGARTPDQHPNLPVTPAELAAEAVAAHRAGAMEVAVMEPVLRQQVGLFLVQFALGE